MKYQLTLTERQAATVVAAMDLMARVCMGDFEEVLWYAPKEREGVPDDGMISRNLEARKYLAVARRLASGLPYSERYSLTSQEVREEARVAWDIKQVVRHRLAWDRSPDGGMTVDFHEPMRVAKEDLPTFEKMP